MALRAKRARPHEEEVKPTHIRTEVQLASTLAPHFNCNSTQTTHEISGTRTLQGAQMIMCCVIVPSRGRRWQ
eukprot:5059828-Alexandrium_andersonii.AAC.1